jgi:hypothetical protein
VAYRASMTIQLSTARKGLTVRTGLMGLMAWMAMMVWMAWTAHTTSNLRHQIKPVHHLPTAHPTWNAIASFPFPGLRQNLLPPRLTRPGGPTNKIILLPHCIATRPSPHFPLIKTRARSLPLVLPHQLLLPFLLQLLLQTPLPLVLSPPALLFAQLSNLVLQTSQLQLPIQLSLPSTPWPPSLHATPRTHLYSTGPCIPHYLSSTREPCRNARLQMRTTRRLECTKSLNREDHPCDLHHGRRFRTQRTPTVRTRLRYPLCSAPQNTSNVTTTIARLAPLTKGSPFVMKRPCNISPPTSSSGTGSSGRNIRHRKCSRVDGFSTPISCDNKTSLSRRTEPRQSAASRLRKK